MNKTEIRRRARAKRLAMDEQTVVAKSRLVVDKLIKNVDWRDVKTVSVYVAMENLNEVETTRLLDYLGSHYPQISVSLQGQSNRDRYSNESFDLVVVPTLAFDGKCNRLGWGGGFYDRFLASHKNALKIGLCFENSRQESIPAERHDIPLDEIITEQYIITRS